MTSATSGPAAPRRAARSDGLRNRRRVLDTAAAAFAERGLDASVNDIARDAGVGVATLYRHFETKERLLSEVVKARLQDLLDVVRALPAAGGAHDPGELLVAWMRLASDHIRHFASVSAWMAATLADDPDLLAVHDHVLAEGRALLEAAQRAGRAAPSATIEDLLAALVAISGQTTGDARRPHRLLTLLTDGVLTPL